VENCGRARETKDDNLKLAPCLLDTTVCKHTLIIRNTYCFFKASILTRTHLIFTLYLHFLPCLFLILLSFVFWQVCTNSSQKRASSTFCSIHTYNFICRLVNYICSFKLQNPSRQFFAYTVNIFNCL
jgi:hypothetical protein